MYHTQARVGGELVRYQVCFSNDEKCIFSCVGGIIKAHNAATGALQGEFRGHTARVTGVFLNPLNTLQLYSTSHDGTIRRWDPSEGMCLQKYDIGVPILTGSIAAGHHLYIALDPSHYTKFLPTQAINTTTTMNNDMNDNQSSQSTIPTATEIQMPSPQDEQRAKNLAYEQGQTLIYICAFDLLTPHNATISTNFQLTDLSTNKNNNSTKQKSQKQSKSTTSSSSSSSTTTLITNNTTDSKENTLQVLFSMKEFTAMSRSRNGDLLAAVGGHEIHVYSKSLRLHGTTKHPHPITCVDVHPKQDLIAVGDITGRITLYINASSLLTNSIDNDSLRSSSVVNIKQDLSGHVNKIVTTVLHWHSHPVRSIKFSIDGNYLLSGGYEGVLVTWQLSNSTSHYLPRLSSFIQHIAVSPKGGIYALSCGDNSIQTLGAFNSQLKHVAHGVNILDPTNRLLPTSFVQALNQNNKVVLITDQGHFQVFDVAHDLHVSTFHLLDRNLLPETILQRQRKGLSSAQLTSSIHQLTHDKEQIQQNLTTSLDITQVIVSPNGRWSCGFYQSPSKHGLRIWAHSSELLPTTEFVSRCIWHDHDNQPVISGVFSSDSQFIVTGHRDGAVRVWVLTTAPDCDLKYPPHQRYMAQTWNIINTMEYQKLPPTKITLSEDNTLLAIGFGNVFTLWSINPHDDYTITFLFSHTFAGAYTEILSICFLPQYPTVYVATQHGLYTFDLLTLSCVGTYFCNIAGMLTHPTLPLVFVMTVVPHMKRELQITNESSSTTTTTTNKKRQDKNNTMNDNDTNDNDDDDDDDDSDFEETADKRLLEKYKQIDDYLGDEVDSLLAQSTSGTTPGATGRDMTCPIYRRLFKYLYRTHVITRFVDSTRKQIPSLRTLPQDRLLQAQKDLNVKLPKWTPLNSHDTTPPPIAAPSSSKTTTTTTTNNQTKSDLLTKPTKECCLLLFRDNRHERPETATSLFDVMLTKTKIPNTNNNPYNTSCYESSLTLTQDFFIYLNRSRELTLIPISQQGAATIQQKSSSTPIQSTISGVLQDIYKLETHSSKLAENATLPSEFTLSGGSKDTSEGTTGQNNPALEQLLATLSNTPAHQITSLSSIYEQFMTPFLPAAK